MRLPSTITVRAVIRSEEQVVPAALLDVQDASGVGEAIAPSLERSRRDRWGRRSPTRSSIRCRGEGRRAPSSGRRVRSNGPDTSHAPRTPLSPGARRRSRGSVSARLWPWTVPPTSAPNTTATKRVVRRTRSVGGNAAAGRTGRAGTMLLPAREGAQAPRLPLGKRPLAAACPPSSRCRMPRVARSPDGERTLRSRASRTDAQSFQRRMKPSRQAVFSPAHVVDQTFYDAQVIP